MKFTSLLLLTLFSLSAYSQVIIYELETTAEMTLSSKDRSKFFVVRCREASGSGWLSTSAYHAVEIYQKQRKEDVKLLSLSVEPDNCNRLDNLQEFFYNQPNAKLFLSYDAVNLDLVEFKIK